MTAKDLKTLESSAKKVASAKSESEKAAAKAAENEQKIKSNLLARHIEDIQRAATHLRKAHRKFLKKSRKSNVEEKELKMLEAQASEAFYRMALAFADAHQTGSEIIPVVESKAVSEEAELLSEIEETNEKLRDI